MTIVELLLELLLLPFVGNCIPGTVVAEERGTDTTRLPSSCFVFACTFCVITCDLLTVNVDDEDDDNGAETVGDVMCDEEAFEVVAAADDEVELVLE